MVDVHDALEPAARGEDELEELLAPILELPAVQQPAALAAICGSRPDRAASLRARHAILCRFGLASDDVPPLDRPHAPEPGGRLGPFRILRRLGRGGMGLVFLAEDLELGREVALKLIRPEYLDSERARERFRREVGIAARLEHPGICTVYRAGEVDGQPYLALQHLRGETLETLLRAARAAGRTAWSGATSTHAGGGATRLRSVDLRPALGLVEQLARAVHCAHEAGLVHRDLKPANVMVTADGRPVLMDFGLARDVQSSDVSVTHSGELIGTPIYMAPEQVAPKGLSVDRRTDVYALGAILYECLTLRPPHSGADREQLYHAILCEEPIELRRLQRAASRDLATVAHKALAKEPARRYPTALAFAEDLLRVLGGVTTLARPPGPWRRAWVLASRHRTITAAGAALMVGLVASLAFLWRSVQSQRRFEALAIVGRAKEVQPEDPELALAAMRRALDIAQVPEVVAAIHGVLPELKAWTAVRQVDGQFRSVVWSPSRRYLVVNGNGAPAGLHASDGTFLGELWVAGDDREHSGELFPQRPAVAFSPDESVMWASIEGTGLATPLGLCRFELGDGGRRLLGVPFPRGQRVVGATSVACSPDGRRLLVTRANPMQRRSWASVHDATSGKKLGENIPLPPDSLGCAFLADGTVVLPGGLWSADGERLRVLDHAADDVARLVLPGGDRFAVAFRAGVRIYTNDGARLGGRERADHRRFEQLHHAEWSPQLDALVVSFQDGEVWLLDAAGSLQYAWNAGSSCHAHFLLDGQRIATGDSKGRVTLWDRGGRMLDRLHGHRHNAHVAPLPSGDCLVVGWDGRARVWHVNESLVGLPFRAGYRWGATLLVDDVLVATDAEGLVHAIDASGAVRASLQLRRGLVTASWHCDQSSVWLSETATDALWCWNPARGTREGPFTPESPLGNPVVGVAHLLGGRLLLATGWEVAMRWFDPASGETSGPLDFRGSHTAAPASGQFAIAVGAEAGVRAPQALKIMMIADDAETVLWSATDPAGSAGVRASSLAVSRDGGRAVIGFHDGAVSVWDVDARRCLATFRDHTHPIVAVALTPDGRTVASATRQGHLCVRELGDGEPRLTWRSADERLHSLTFLDDHTLASTGTDLQRLRWWWWEPDRLQEVLGRLRLPPLEPSQQRDLERLLGR